MLLEEVSEVRRCLVGEEEEFELDALLSREPVELEEDGCDELPEVGVSVEVGSRVLDV